MKQVQDEDVAAHQPALSLSYSKGICRQILPKKQRAISIQGILAFPKHNILPIQPAWIESSPNLSHLSYPIDYTLEIFQLIQDVEKA